MPANDSGEFLRLPLSFSFVVDAKNAPTSEAGPGNSWHSDRDFRKIRKEVEIAETFLEGLSQLAYFTLDRSRDNVHYELLRKLGFIDSDWNPEEKLLSELVSGRSLKRFFEQYHPLLEQLEIASRFLVFEIETISIGNSLHVENVNIQVNMQGGPSGEPPKDSKIIDRIIAFLTPLVAGLALFYQISNAPIKRVDGKVYGTPFSETDKTIAEALRDPRYQEIMHNLAHSSTKHFAATAVQTLLKKVGFDPGIIDGDCGSITKNAVKQFWVQEFHVSSDDWMDPNFILRLIERTRQIEGGVAH